MGDKLVLGAGTVLAHAPKGVVRKHELGIEVEARMIALLSAAYHAPIPDQALACVRRAVFKWAEGDKLLALTHLALSGLPRLAEPVEAARRLFICDGIVRHGIPPLKILEALSFRNLGNNQLRRDYNADELRNPKGDGVESGRWTKDPSGDSGSVEPPKVSGGIATDEPDPLFGESVLRRALRLLFRLIPVGVAAKILFQTIFIPGETKTQASQIEIPGRPDLRFNRISSATSVSFEAFIDGHWVTLSYSSADAHGFYRDAKGRVFARNVGLGIIANLNALDRLKRELSDEPASGTVADETRNKPQLCPERTKEDVTGRSELTKSYQEWVSKLPKGFDITLNDVRFDGCLEADNAASTPKLLEAKADLQQFMTPDGEWKYSVIGKNITKQFEDQLLRQSAAAAKAGWRVEWHVLQDPVAMKIRGLIEMLRIGNIDVVTDLGPPK